MRLKVYWKLTLPPSRASLVLTTLCPILSGYAQCWRIDAFKLWHWRRILRVPWTARRSNQILKEISPEYSLEGLMLKLKLQYLATWCKELTHWKDPDAGKDWRLPGSSVTRVQGYPQDEQHWWKNDTGRPSLGEVRPITLFFKGAFIPWLVHRGKWKMQSHAESAQTF